MTETRKTLAEVRRNVTSYDVALRAGVSQSAVSRCFKEGASVAPATRARIIEAAEALGYSPNAIAQGLITRRSNLVGVVISNLTNLNYPEVLAELTRRFSEHDVRVLLFTLQAESDVPQVLSQIWRYRVDGVVAAARLEPAAIDQFDRRGVPLVLYNRDGDGASVSSVCCDSRAGERALVDRLVAAGHGCFGLITGPADSHVSQERINGAAGRLRELGLPFEVADGAFDYHSGEVGVRRLMLATQNRMDALICANDVMAIGAMDAARFALQLRVPEQLSIVGFDGVGPAAWASYRLTTVRQPVHRMTEAAVAMLIERIERPDVTPERRLFAGEVIPGSSARLPG